MKLHITRFLAPLFIGALACSNVESDDPYLVLKLAEGEPPAVDGVGIVIVIQAHGGAALTLEVTGGVFVDPMCAPCIDGPDTDTEGCESEPCKSLCFPVADGAQSILLQPDTDAKAVRVIGRLWSEDVGTDCEGVSTLVASNSLLIDPQDVATTDQSGTTADSGTTATDSGTTATDSGTTDSGTTDSGTTDSGTTDSGTTDSGTTDTTDTGADTTGTTGP